MPQTTAPQRLLVCVCHSRWAHNHSRTKTTIAESPHNVFSNSHVETWKSIQPKWNIPLKKASAAFKIVQHAFQSDSENCMHVSCLPIWHTTKFQNERSSDHVICTLKKNPSAHVVIWKTFSKHCWKIPQCPFRINLDFLFLKFRWSF